jgi:hypothetical protein
MTTVVKSNMATMTTATQCGRCHCALSDLELADAITDDDGEIVCVECQKEAAQERSCADVGEALLPAG